MYENGGGGGDGGGGGGGGDVDNKDDTDVNDSVSTGGGSNGSDFEDYSSWTEDTVSYAGTSDSSSSSSSTDNGNKAIMKKRGLMDGGGNSGKWLKSLWTIIDRMDRGDPNNKLQSAQPVKTILRPPTTYKYVIGMSGFPSKVAIYPRRM